MPVATPPVVRQSVCALDCPDCCSLLINIDPATGRGSKLRGNPDHPVTRGFLCGKVARYLEREYSPDRLLYPMRRTGAKGEGKFVRISWDEALQEVATRLRDIAAQYGPESVLPYSYAGTMGYLQSSGMDRRFFHRLGASRLDRTICSNAGSTGLNQSFGTRLGMDPEQFRHSKLILGWASNILGNNVHLWPFIVEARRNGAKFYVIDPVRTRTAAAADRHYQINPGTDMALALGMIHVILAEKLEDRDYINRYTNGFAELAQQAQTYTPDRVSQLTGLAASDIVQLAREYATTKPAAIRLNYGIQRSERGGNATRAVAALPILIGAMNQVGAGIQMSTSGGFVVNRKALDMPELQERSALGREARLINMSELGKALTETDNPRVHALVVYNSNPAAVAPNQNSVLKGLRRDDLFTVVIEQFQTDTADHADILLPATTFLEHSDLYFAYGHYHMQLAHPVLDPPGEARSNLEIFRELARRCGFTEPCFEDSIANMMRATLDSGHPYLNGVTLERLEKERSVRLNLAPEGEAFLPFAHGNFPTASGKFEFGAEALQYTPPIESRLGDAELKSRFPLEYLSSKNDNGMNSTFGNRADVEKESGFLDLNAVDAEARGIRSGDSIRVFNDRGSLVLQAYVDGVVAPGVVRTRAVRWPKLAPDKRGPNALTSERLTDIGGGATFYSCLVQVEKCGD